MTLPAAAPTTHLNNASDDPAQARATLKTAIDTLNAVITHLGLSTLTSGATPAAATGGLEVSGTNLRSAHSFRSITGNDTAEASDRGRVLYLNGPLTLDFEPCATLGDGWWCIIVNFQPSGVNTLDPNGSETIDGATQINAQRLEAFIVACNGTLLRTIGRGKVAQVQSLVTGAVATGTTQTVHDDTIPQNTEGDEYMSLAITPSHPQSTLIVDVVWIGTHSSAVPATLIAALFQDSTANALAARSKAIDANGNMEGVEFRHKLTPGSLSAITFKVRAGANAAGTTTFNGTAGARRLGGVMASSIVITEVLP